MRKIENPPKNLHFKKERIEAINEARRKRGLWTTRKPGEGDFLRPPNRGGGTFKGIKRSK